MKTQENCPSFNPPKNLYFLAKLKFKILDFILFKTQLLNPPFFFLWSPVSDFDQICTKVHVVEGAGAFEHVLGVIRTPHEAPDAVVRWFLAHLLQNSQVFLSLDSCVQFWPNLHQSPCSWGCWSVWARPRRHPDTTRGCRALQRSGRTSSTFCYGCRIWWTEMSVIRCCRTHWFFSSLCPFLGHIKKTLVFLFLSFINQKIRDSFL